MFLQQLTELEVLLYQAILDVRFEEIHAASKKNRLVPNAADAAAQRVTPSFVRSSVHVPKVE